jgi:hypothetical protein
MSPRNGHKGEPDKTIRKVNALACQSSSQRPDVRDNVQLPTERLVVSGAEAPASEFDRAGPKPATATEIPSRRNTRIIELSH